MAITQTGSSLSYVSNVGLPQPAVNSGTVDSTITVPADAEFVIATWSGYDSTSTYFSTGSMTFTKGGVDTAMTSVSGGDTLNGWCAAMFYLALPDTGSNKTLKYDWLGTLAPVEHTSLCTVSFWKGMNTGSPVRGTGGAQAGSAPYTSTSITALTGDLIVAWVGASTIVPSVDGTVDSWSNLSLLSQFTVGASGSSADGALATGSPTGDTTVAASTTTGLQDGGIVAISLKPASAVPFTGYVFSVGHSNKAPTTRMIGY